MLYYFHMYNIVINVFYALESESRSVGPTLCNPHGLDSPWNSPGQNIGVGSRSLLQGNLPNPGMEPRSPALQLSPKGSPRMLEWVAYLFYSGSSRPRSQTRVPCIAGKLFTNRAIRGALYSLYSI